MPAKFLEKSLWAQGSEGIDSGGAASFGRAHAESKVFGDLLVEVKLNFTVEFLGNPFALK